MQFKEGSVFPLVKYKGIGRCPFPYRRVSPLPPPCPLTLLRIQKGNNNPAGGGWPHVVPLGGGWLACFASLHLDPSTTLTAAGTLHCLSWNWIPSSWQPNWDLSCSDCLSFVVNYLLP